MAAIRSPGVGVHAIGGPNNNPTNVEAILNLPPAGLGVPNDAGYTPSNQMYLYNECDLIISNSATGTNGNSVWGTNLSVYYDGQYNSSHLTLLTNDLQWTNTFITTNGSGSIKTYSTNPITYKFYSFLTNVTFYDYREKYVVQAVQIDIANFSIWLTNTATRGGVTNLAGYPWNVQCFNHKGQGINGIYVYNSVQRQYRRSRPSGLSTDSKCRRQPITVTLLAVSPSPHPCRFMCWAITISRPTAAAANPSHDQYLLDLPRRAYGRRHHHPFRQLE